MCVLTINGRLIAKARLVAGVIRTIGGQWAGNAR